MHHILRGISYPWTLSLIRFEWNNEKNSSPRLLIVGRLIVRWLLSLTARKPNRLTIPVMHQIKRNTTRKSYHKLRPEFKKTITKLHGEEIRWAKDKRLTMCSIGKMRSSLCSIIETYLRWCWGGRVSKSLEKFRSPILNGRLGRKSFHLTLQSRTITWKSRLRRSINPLMIYMRHSRNHGRKCPRRRRREIVF